MLGLFDRHIRIFQDQLKCNLHKYQDLHNSEKLSILELSHLYIIYFQIYYNQHIYLNYYHKHMTHKNFHIYLGNPSQQQSSNQNRPQNYLNKYNFHNHLHLHKRIIYLELQNNQHTNFVINHRQIIYNNHNSYSHINH